MMEGKEMPVGSVAQDLLIRIMEVVDGIALQPGWQ